MKDEFDFAFKVLPLVEQLTLEEKEILSFLCFPRKMAAQREKQSWTARNCLLSILQDWGLPFQMGNLSIENHHFLSHLPQICVSISHTSNAGAAMVANRSLYQSVGLDFESRERKMAEGIHRFFINAHDDSHLSPLEIWVRKEAAFKAISPLYHPMNSKDNPSRPLILKNIWVNEQHFGLLDQYSSVQSDPADALKRGPKFGGFFRNPTFGVEWEGILAFIPQHPSK